MITLPYVFSDGALFQQNSNLDIHGSADAGAEVKTALYSDKDGALIDESVSAADADGKFIVTLHTQAASFDTYTIKISTGADSVEIKDVLFGELWFASGQSNMEFTNYFMPDKDNLFAKMAGKNIRIFAQSSLANIPMDGEFPFEPVSDTVGSWIKPEDTDKLQHVSAAASAAVNYMYDYLNEGSFTIPVGFLNISMGATRIATWLSRDSIMNDAPVHDYLEKVNMLPTKERFNTYGGGNFNQPCALYNLKVECVLGVKSRGVFWYQGEGDIGGREQGKYYMEAMRVYQELYSTLFKSESETTYPMISSQLFPYLYNEHTCAMAHINEAFSAMPMLYPDKFSCATIYDLPPIWAYGLGNHPIHPANKYGAGQRLGELALTNCYGKKGIKTAVTYATSRRSNGKIRVRFNTGKNKLYSCGKLSGFYICGKNNIYVEAKAEIISSDVVELSNPYIAEPKYAAYQFSDMALNGGLRCGGMAVAPFATDKKNPVHIMPKPWIHTGNDAVWVQNEISDKRLDYFYRPTWIPENGSMICRDDVFRTTVGEKALRVISIENADTAAAYVLPYPANRLDMFNYRGMIFNLTGSKKVGCTVEFICAVASGETRILSFNAEKTADLNGDSASYKVSFDLPQCDIKRMTFRFDFAQSPVKAANIDGIELIVK